MDVGLEAILIAFVFVIAAVAIPLATLRFFVKKRDDG